VPLALRIPEGLRDVIGKRLSRLSAASNRVLAVAAVCGREFELSTLRAVAELGEAALESALEEATRAAVLQEQERPGVVRYRFAHAFFRQTLYEELSAPRRLRLHQQVARALEAQYATRLEEHAAELAEHFAHSTDHADLAKAVAYGERAAARAVAVYAYGEAVRLLEGALEVQAVLDPDDQATRCDLLLTLGAALLPAGEPLRVADDVAEEALRLAEALADQRRAARACRLAVEGLMRYGPGTVLLSPQYRGWAERLSARAEPESVEQVWADTALAGVLYSERRYRQSWAVRLRALVLARRLGDPEPLFWAAFQVLGLPSSPKTMATHLAVAEEAVTWPRDGAGAGRVGPVLFLCGYIFLASGQRERAAVLWRQVDDLAERDDPFLRVFAMYTQALRATLDGDLVGAVAAADQLVARTQELGTPVYGAQFGEWAACQPLLYLGRFEELNSREEEYARIAGLQVRLHPTILSRHALTSALMGRQEDARHALETALAAGVDDAASTSALVLLLEAALVLGERDWVATLAALLEPAAPCVNTLPLTVVARHLGAAAAFLGEPVRARAYYQQALAVAGQVRFRPELALTRLQLAELLLEHYPDEQAEALAHLDAAIPELRAVHMQPALARALALRSRLAPQPAPAAASPEGARRAARAVPAAVPSERRLVTVLFTDIVSSTAHAAALGDRRWAALKARHHALVRQELDRFGGHEVDTAGDGFFATFQTPAQAVRCACAVRDAVRTLDLEVRAGLHTGEVEVQDAGVSGIAVHTGARVLALAGPGQVLVSRTVTELAAGAGIDFTEHGTHRLKGVPGEWTLFAVAAVDDD
jgi:class 3 adenylate cyclase